jgi:hypothetical protein
MPAQADLLVDRYVKLRDAKTKLANQTKEKVAVIEEAMAKIEAVLLSQFNEEGVESVRTAAGTAYKDNKTFATVGDWEAFLEFVRVNEAWPLLKHDVVKKAVEEYKEANDDALPPGVDWREETVIKVRRA